MKKIRVGITQGDINGIGLEVILKTFANPEMLDLCLPIIYSSNRTLTYHRKALTEIPGYQINHIDNALRAVENMPNLVDCYDEEIKVEYGKPSKDAGRAAFLALETAVSDLKQGVIDVIVTAPINKENIQSDQFTFPGHTEYLQSAVGEGSKALMILFNEHLRVALVTTHLPLAQVPAALTIDGIKEKLITFNNSLRRDFNIDQPRIAVLSLNPHAGENGLLGNEENTIIKPALKQAADEEHIFCFGPFASDGFFGSEQWRRYDGVLAMYHDQGLTAFKTIAHDDGVNFTAGLPIVRTSPDHGTGYDIAGKGIAHEGSMRAAIFAAIDIARNRARYDVARANPLGKLYVNRGKDNDTVDLAQADKNETEK